MAEVTKLVDDMDGSEDAVKRVLLSYDGTDYEIDLSKKNKDTLNEVLKDWLGHARRMGATSGRLARGGARSGTTRRDRTQTSHRRQWARENGWPDISERGRIPHAAEVAYEEAHR